MARIKNALRSNSDQDHAKVAQIVLKISEEIKDRYAGVLILTQSKDKNQFVIYTRRIPIIGTPVIRMVFSFINGKWHYSVERGKDYYFLKGIVEKNKTKKIEFKELYLRMNTKGRPTANL